MKNLIEELKDKGQDYEFYPTTNEIINKINSLYNKGSILDIGCGNGQTLMEFEGFDKKFGIEKSDFLISKCDPSIIIIGTDFKKQTLIDKEIDNIFCNPPYSEFKEWTKKILLEANCQKIYLVIPSRWSDDEEIKHIIKERGWHQHILGSYDFLEAERRARAFVDLISFSKSSYGSGKSAFDMFFEQTFKINAEKKESTEAKKAKLQNALVAGGDLIKTLTSLYDKELEHIFENYRKIESLDGDLLKELGIEVENIKESLRLRIKGLKKLYWSELFSNFDKIYTRLTFKYRRELREKLSINVDFNEENILAVMIWIVNNTNSYIDKQLVDVFYQLTNEKNIKNYKSNQKTWVADDFRFQRINASHYSLEHRIVVELWGSEYLDNGKFKYEYHYSGDCNRMKEMLQDIIAIAFNLGYFVEPLPLEGWEYGQTREIMAGDKVFMEVKIFRKGTVHIKFMQEFIKRLNVNVSRLLGWIKNKSQASEMEMTESEFESNIVNTKITKQLLLN